MLKFCDGKVAHRYFGAACKAQRKLRDETGDLNLYVYRCTVCGWWHVGHLTDPLKQAPLRLRRRYKKL